MASAPRLCDGKSLAPCDWASSEKRHKFVFRASQGHVRVGSEAVMAAYSITSVAKPKTDVGISMPSIFAVFKFTTNSNLLD
jgi:hypothetical protein